MKKENKSVVFQFRVTPTEAERISGWVERSGLDLPDYLRFVVMRGLAVTVQVHEPDDAEHQVRSVTVESGEEVMVPKQRKHGTG